MRRFLLGFLIALALVVPATIIAAPPHTVNVTNPMTTDLNGGQRDIFNLHDLFAATATTDAYYLGTTISSFAIKAGFDNPSVVCCYGARPGSLYLENGDGTSNTYGTKGALWLKTGPNPTDWTLVAGSP